MKKKIFASEILVVTLCCLTCIAVGFSSWAIVGQGSSQGSGNLNGNADGVFLDHVDGLNISNTHNPNLGTYFFNGEPDKTKASLIYQFAVDSSLSEGLKSNPVNGNYEFIFSGTFGIKNQAGNYLEAFNSEGTVLGALKWGDTALTYTSYSTYITFDLLFKVPTSSVALTSNLSFEFNHQLVLLLRNQTEDKELSHYSYNLELRLGGKAS